MTDLWYWVQRTLGRWYPRTAPDMPPPVTSEGWRLVMRGLIKVDAGHTRYSLNALRELYSIDGRLIYTQGPDHVRKIRALAA